MRLRGRDSDYRMHAIGLGVAAGLHLRIPMRDREGSFGIVSGWIQVFLRLLLIR
jgi:hypothetical protein